MGRENPAGKQLALPSSDNEFLIVHAKKDEKIGAGVIGLLIGLGIYGAINSPEAFKGIYTLTSLVMVPTALVVGNDVRNRVDEIRGKSIGVKKEIMLFIQSLPKLQR